MIKNNFLLLKLIQKKKRMKEGGREKLLTFFSPDLKNELKRRVAIKVEIYTKIRKKISSNYNVYIFRIHFIHAVR